MTEAALLKKIRNADAVANRHAPGTSYHTRAVHDGQRYRKMLACLQAEGSLKNWMDYNA